jgi:hypothetical protein
LGSALLGIGAFVLIASALQQEVGVPFDTTYRVMCAAACLIFIWNLRSYYPGEGWPRVGLWIALFVNVSLFFTPLFHRPSSRGELMLFALPDAIVLLIARIASYHVADTHQRAMRMHMIFGLVIAVTFCTVLFALALNEPSTGY